MQQMAQLAGLAYLTPSYLSVHSEFGPWFALRAAVSINCPASGIPGAVLEEAALENPCSPEEEQEMIARMKIALEYNGAEDGRWRKWLDVRDGLPCGRQWRYSDPQILYHYTKSSASLLTTGTPAP
jgi:hypothetical protein